MSFLPIQVNSLFTINTIQKNIIDLYNIGYKEFITSLQFLLYSSFETPVKF